MLILYVTIEVPTGLCKQTHLLSSLYIHAKSHSISSKKKTKDFEEKQPGDFVSQGRRVFWNQITAPWPTPQGTAAAGCVTHLS